MDHSYVAIDVDTVLKSGPTAATPLLHSSPHIDSLLIKPTISSNNMQLSHAPAGFYADRNMKCEEIASDMFSRAAAVQLYDRLQLADTMRHSPLGVGVEFRSLRSVPVPSCVPAFDVKDYIASSTSFNFLTPSSDIVAQMSTSSTSLNGLGMKVIHHEHLAGHVNTKPHINSMVVTSSLGGFPSNGNMMDKQALEPTQSFSSKNMAPSHYADNANMKLGSYTPDCISTSHHQLHLPSESHPFPDILAKYADSPNSPNSPSKQDSVLSAEDLDPDLQKASAQAQTSKRRKTQQKRTVYVPVGDAKHNLKGETPPSDMWAWRKYGQKPIKGSPYPRGYYRCSSSKGCSARKQVERSCTDPTMLIVTYTSDHNHDWPVTKTNSSLAQVLTPLSPLLPKDKVEADDQSEEVVTTTKSSCVESVNESLFSSIVNSVSSVDEQVVSSLDVTLIRHEEETFSLKRDVDLCFLPRTSTTEEEDGVFDDLGELPELSSIFSKGYLEDHQHVNDGWFVH